MAAMKGTGVCLCDSPLRFDHGYCGRCWNRQFATDAGAHGQPNPLSADAPPVPTAGESVHSPADPLAGYPVDLDPWDADPADDYAEAYNDADTARIGAIFEKRTGRP
jgi:hypothetical protein